jgi:hypothetical protein
MANENEMFLIAGSFLVVCAVILAGCVQDDVTPAQSGTGGQPPIPAGTPGRFSGQGFHPNLTAAAEKLGVTREQLDAVLNTTLEGRMNLTYDAQLLGVTPEQLADALGLRFNASRTRPGPGAGP